VEVGDEGEIGRDCKDLDVGSGLREALWIKRVEEGASHSCQQRRSDCCVGNDGSAERTQLPSRIGRMRLAELSDGRHVKRVRPSLAQLQRKKRQGERNAVNSEGGRAEPGGKDQPVDLASEEAQCRRKAEPGSELPLLAQELARHARFWPSSTAPDVAHDGVRHGARKKTANEKNDAPGKIVSEFR